MTAQMSSFDNVLLNCTAKLRAALSDGPIHQGIPLNHWHLREKREIGGRRRERPTHWPVA